MSNKAILIAAAIAAAILLLAVVVKAATEKPPSCPTSARPVTTEAASTVAPSAPANQLVVAPSRPGIEKYLQDQAKIANHTAIVNSGQVGTPYPGQYPQWAASGGAYIGPVIAPFKPTPEEIPTMYQTSAGYEMPIMRG